MKCKRDCRPRIQVWMTAAQELAQDYAHHAAHAWFGALVPALGAATGWWSWRAGVAAVGIFAVAWEVVPALIVKPENGWRASVIGIVSYWIGAVAFTVCMIWR